MLRMYDRLLARRRGAMVSEGRETQRQANSLSFVYDDDERMKYEAQTVP